MNAGVLTLFVSLVLAVSGIGFFLFSFAQREQHHHDRLSLLPLEDDDHTLAPSDALDSSETFSSSLQKTKD